MDSDNNYGENNSETTVKKAIEILRQSNDHKVITRYKKPQFYNLNSDLPKKTGVFLDIESTGLSYDSDKLIELGMVKFEYSDDGRIFHILDEFNEYQDPDMEIPPFITELTGITKDMVCGKQIDEFFVAEFLKGVDLIIAHNAQFDRAFFESTFPNIEAKAWACSMHDIKWNSEHIESHKLEYIAYKYDFFYEGHKAITDCLVGIHLLSQTLYKSGQFALKQLLDNALCPMYKLWAKNAPYAHKDLLRARNYRWNVHPAYGFKAWSIEIPEHKVEDEIYYLKSNIYNWNMNIPVDVFDAYSRFSLVHGNKDSGSHKYADKMDWIKQLQISGTTNATI